MLGSKKFQDALAEAKVRRAKVLEAKSQKGDGGTASSTERAKASGSVSGPDRSEASKQGRQSPDRPGDIVPLPQKQPDPLSAWLGTDEFQLDWNKSDTRTESDPSLWAVLTDIVDEKLPRRAEPEVEVPDQQPVRARRRAILPIGLTALAAGIGAAALLGPRFLADPGAGTSVAPQAAVTLTVPENTLASLAPAPAVPGRIETLAALPREAPAKAATDATSDATGADLPAAGAPSAPAPDIAAAAPDVPDVPGSAGLPDGAVNVAALTPGFDPNRQPPAIAGPAAEAPASPVIAETQAIVRLDSPVVQVAIAKPADPAPVGIEGSLEIAALATSAWPEAPAFLPPVRQGSRDGLGTAGDVGASAGAPVPSAIARMAPLDGVAPGQGPSTAEPPRQIAGLAVPSTTPDLAGAGPTASDAAIGPTARDAAATTAQTRMAALGPVAADIPAASAGLSAGNPGPNVSNSVPDLASLDPAPLAPEIATSGGPAAALGGALAALGAGDRRIEILAGDETLLSQTVETFSSYGFADVTGETTTVAPFGSVVRFYREGDAEIARLVASDVGAEVQDLSSFRPAPDTPLIEVLISRE